MKRLQSELTQAQVILNGQWKFFELTFDRAVTNFKYPHGLNFVPRDVIQTSTRGNGFIQWNYDLFDFNYLDVSTSDSCVIRAFIGRYTEGGQI
jgi:hypothetical protein